eukprot:scaffold31674_cov56-Phaeocystis_antarctica.AAC.1
MDALELRLKRGLVAQQQAVRVQKNAQLLLREPVVVRLPRRAGHLRKTATGSKFQEPLQYTPIWAAKDSQAASVVMTGGVRVEARFGQPTASLLKRHEQGLRLGQVLLCQLGAFDLEGGAGDVGGADGDLRPGGRQAHGRDA